MTEDQITALIADLVTSQGGWALVAAVTWWTGRQALKHLCEVVPRVLAVAEKVADDGIRLHVHLDDDTDNTNTEADA